MATIKKPTRKKALKAVAVAKVKTVSSVTALLKQAKNLLVKRLIEQETKKYMAATAKERNAINKNILTTKKLIKKLN